MADGEIKEKKYQFKPGVCLATKANRSEYDSFIIDEIDKEVGTVSFKNGAILKLGSPHGGEQEAVFRAQIRYTIEQHFRRQQQLDDDAKYAEAAPLYEKAVVFAERAYGAKHINLSKTLNNLANVYVALVFRQALMFG